MGRFILTVVAALVLATASSTGANAAQKCLKSDCSDAVPSYIVKDNLGKAKNFWSDRENGKHSENIRRHRTNIKRREQQAPVVEAKQDA